MKDLAEIKQLLRAPKPYLYQTHGVIEVGVLALTYAVNSAPTVILIF